MRFIRQTKLDKFQMSLIKFLLKQNKITLEAFTRQPSVVRNNCHYLCSQEKEEIDKVQMIQTKK